MMPVRLLILILLAGLTGCLQVRYVGRQVEEPQTAAGLAGLQPGRDDLGAVLAQLGAPHFVWEYRGDGIALGWVWQESAGWELRASYNVIRFGSASLNLEWEDSNLPGVVLWFDADLVLERWRRGVMRELASGLRRRPASTTHH